MSKQQSPAPIQYTIRGVDDTGRDVMLNLYAYSGQELDDLLQDAIKTVNIVAGERVRSDPGNRRERSTNPARSGDNGRSLPTCAIHGVKMFKRSSGGEQWYSHRLESGEWCRGEE